jgi:hypothetical protein
MHRKYAPDGLVVMTVDLDERELKKKDKVVEFLGKQEATFPHFILDDSAENVKAWKAKHRAELDTKLIFDRAGNQVRVPTDLDDDEFEPFLRKVLDKK